MRKSRYEKTFNSYVFPYEKLGVKGTRDTSFEFIVVP